ncbi:MAG: hypothetical protein JNM47_16740 [Hyphomonadaceae bacterium]|nr:hypothetical protein [Hyphomonadaceae bacterium]
MGAPTFDLYKLLVEEVREARRARRELANVFTTLNLGGVGALGFLAGPNAGSSAGLLIWAVVALVLICIVWRTSNAYFTRLLGAKYAILYSVETELGIDPIQREWRAMGDRTLFNFFSFERLMPLLFAIGYAIFIAYHVSWAEAVQLFETAIRPLKALIGG